jgi:glycine/D-amino acid oxidase-like deaminating enzyme
LGTGLKVGDHSFSLAGDPAGDRDPRLAEIDAVVNLARRRFAGFERYHIAKAKVCFYTVEPHERFVVEPLGRAWLMSPCSGHGFKFSPVLGRRVAEAISGVRDGGEVSRWAAGG